MPPIESATDLINGASRLGETTYQVMVGNRMTGETRPARMQRHVHYVNGVELGASQEVEAAANAEAWKDSLVNGARWAWPSPVLTTAQAAVAARYLLLEAEKEANGRQGVGYFDRLAGSAAYTYYRGSETPKTVLTRVLNLVKDSAPRVADKARKLLAWASAAKPVAAAKPAAAKKRRRSTSAPSQDYETLPEVAPPTAWEQITAGLPPWAPTAAGVVAVGLAVITFWPKPRAA
jgi:hypothetical protein